MTKRDEYSGNRQNQHQMVLRHSDNFPHYSHYKESQNVTLLPRPFTQMDNYYSRPVSRVYARPVTQLDISRPITRGESKTPRESVHIELVRRPSALQRALVRRQIVMVKKQRRMSIPAEGLPTISTNSLRFPSPGKSTKFRQI